MPPSTPRPTLRDVARIAGVSHVTVSRVVRGSRAVVPETARRVRAAIAKLGYQPDPVLSSLAAYRSARHPARRTGSVLAFLDRDGTPYSRIVQRGVEGEAARLGYRVERFPLFSSPGEAAQRRLSRLLYQRGVCGLLFGPSDGAWTLAGWEWERFAAVSLGALQHLPAMDTVAMDYFQGAFDGAEALWQAGCRRIGLVLESHLETRSGHRWIGGYKGWLVARGLPFLHADWGKDGTKLKAWARRHRIDGVLTIDSAVWNALRPQEVRMVFLNGFDCPAGVPHLALDPEAIGIEGVRRLHPLLLRQEFGLPEQPKMTALQAFLKEG
ncbi:LacI family transcriptional regulator/LacI family transcriptional regulator, fructose operon transcriptional repressor [Verrucomicrobium sp. GAS474]|uniref:LacI family DNA-binding transcriptional regulator n=1 Tax=Verrucomicrobium sp. GAS474 TaxID=1882831 RepID=UPI00087948F4|nr:LacI family DNA-binding transcriptional regulator [Verrucomicrobium sp. GAS474]SDT89432.1 LacI family transcriptional regulator/LacI family transcriptional regulator, fructose operon transcriptional repressor [Verrucomicrobium sp. GAS474]